MLIIIEKLATLVFAIIWRHWGNHAVNYFIVLTCLLFYLSNSSTSEPVRSFFQTAMFKLLVLTSLLTSVTLAQSTVGYFTFFQLTLFITLFRLITLLQTPSFPLTLVQNAPRSWTHLIRMPPSPAALLRWRISPLPSPQAAQPLHHQTLRLLCPNSALRQSQACAPSLSYGHSSRLSSPHAPTSWRPMPSSLFVIFMTSCIYFSRSKPPFAQKTTLANIVH